MKIKKKKYIYTFWKISNCKKNVWIFSSLRFKTLQKICSYTTERKIVVYACPIRKATLLYNKGVGTGDVFLFFLVVHSCFLFDCFLFCILYLSKFLYFFILWFLFPYNNYFCFLISFWKLFVCRVPNQASVKLIEKKANHKNNNNNNTTKKCDRFVKIYQKNQTQDDKKCTFKKTSYFTPYFPLCLFSFTHDKTERLWKNAAWILSWRCWHETPK